MKYISFMSADLSFEVAVYNRNLNYYFCHVHYNIRVQDTKLTKFRLQVVLNPFQNYSQHNAKFYFFGIQQSNYASEIFILKFLQT